MSRIAGKRKALDIAASLAPVKATRSSPSRYRFDLKSSRRSSSPNATGSRPKELRDTMLDNLEITWLGTSAGSPSKTRNVSSTAIRLDGEMWFVDLGEATQHQLQHSKLKLSSASKIFLTHMHGDHTFGLVPLLCALADGAGGVVEGADPRDIEAAKFAPIDIYGLSGTRRLIRMTLECTYTHLARKYRVHELLFPHDQPFSGRRNRQELEGRDIWLEGSGTNACWRDILADSEKMRAFAVPIRHTVPCVGFVFEEHHRPGNVDPAQYADALQRNKQALLAPPWNLKNPMQVLRQLKESPEPITLPDGTVIEPPPSNTNGRKLVILGDTYDAESAAMDELAHGADVVVHEATNAYLPGLDEALRPEDTYATVYQKSRNHGHSTPQVAGQFAKRVGAKHLFLNHLSSRYIDAGSTLYPSGTGPVPVDLSPDVAVTELGRDRSGDYSAGTANGDFKRRVETVCKIEEQATEAWSPAHGGRAVATRDFMSIVLKRKKA